MRPFTDEVAFELFDPLNGKRIQIISGFERGPLSLRFDADPARPFVYRSDEKGFLLYSVGENGTDDGGKTYGEGGDADDLAARVKLNAASDEVLTD